MALTDCLVRLVWDPRPVHWHFGWREVRYPDGRLLVQAFCAGPLELQWWPRRNGGEA